MASNRARFRRLRRLLIRLCEFHAAQVELHERMLLLEQPWKEDLLHWSGTGPGARLHGHLPPQPFYAGGEWAGAQMSPELLVGACRERAVGSDSWAPAAEGAAHTRGAER